MKKLLVTGASGFLGSRVAGFYRKKYEVYAPFHREMDIMGMRRSLRNGRGISVWLRKS